MPILLIIFVHASHRQYNWNMYVTQLESLQFSASFYSSPIRSISITSFLSLSHSHTITLSHYHTITGGDVFVHAKCNDVSTLFQLSELFLSNLPKGSVEKFEDIYSFVYRNGRDLSGFIDGKPFSYDNLP